MEKLKNYINGKWVNSNSKEFLDVINPATQEVLAKVPCGKVTSKDIDEAVKSAHQAYLEWKDVPTMKRVQPLFKLKMLLEENKIEISKIITTECGKTLKESEGEI